MKNTIKTCFIIGFTFINLCILHSATLPLAGNSQSRKLNIVREYDINIKKGAVNAAALPALTSFVGMTNSQIIRSSQFAYSEKPDEVKIISDNLGMPRKYYELTWKNPVSNKIKVTETLEVELISFHTLYTNAEYPYSADIKKRFENSLGVDKEEGVDPADPRFDAACAAIAKKSTNAEEIVELVIDWINENIQFKSWQDSVDVALKNKNGNCTAMSKIACIMLRKLGIPVELVDAKFIGSDGGHEFVEVYFPDAGWIFYDPSNMSRGYLNLNCILTAGYSYCVGSPEANDWVSGYFCKETDAGEAPKLSYDGSRSLRSGPKDVNVLGVTVVKKSPPPDVKIRQIPIRELILNAEIKPGVPDKQ
jgi:hypothetical protein